LFWQMLQPFIRMAGKGQENFLNTTLTHAKRFPHQEHLAVSSHSLNGTFVEY